MRKTLLAAAATFFLTPPQIAFASPVAYDDPAGFLAVIAGFDAETEDFESSTAGTIVNSGDSIGSLTFRYGYLDPLRMAVTDGNEFGGSLAAPTTSPVNFLATNDLDVFVGGDDFTMVFAAVNAIGLYIISAEIPNTTIFDDDLILSAAGIDAALDIDISTDLGSGNFAYFLGIVDDMNTFSTASLSANAAAIGAMTYVVDDITLASEKVNGAPVPATFLLVATGLLGAARLGKCAARNPSAAGI